MSDIHEHVCPFDVQCQLIDEGPNTCLCNRSSVSEQTGNGEQEKVRLYVWDVFNKRHFILYLFRVISEMCSVTDLSLYGFYVRHQ
jgi:hypothetical protein